MRSKLMTIALLLSSLPLVALAQTSPVGRYKTFDEDTGKPRLIVDVFQAKDGTIAAKVVETLYAPNANCTECRGAAKGKPVAGMVILWGLKPDGDDGEYSGGTVLKLSNGKTYKSKARVLDGGKQFEVSGCLGFICKHQTWTREG